MTTKKRKSLWLSRDRGYTLYNGKPKWNKYHNVYEGMGIYICDFKISDFEKYYNIKLEAGQCIEIEYPIKLKVRKKCGK